MDMATAADKPLLHASLPKEFTRRAERMPSLMLQLLVNNCDPSEVCADLLVESLCMPVEMRRLAQRGLDAKAEVAVLQCPALSVDACAKLRHAVNMEKQVEEDTVDGAPDHQRNLSPCELEGLVGVDALRLLWSLPERFGVQKRFEEHDVQIFIRKYTVDSRPWNPFHVDSAVCTVNVALVDDGSFEGGRLLGCYNGGVRTIERLEGEATVHASTLLHAVTSMTAGVRYSLIMFFGKPEVEKVLFDSEMREADAAALCKLMANQDLLRRCSEASFDESSMLANFAILRSNADLGKTIERVVRRYNAPQLRPVLIAHREWMDDTACFSLHNLLHYSVHGIGYVEKAKCVESNMNSRASILCRRSQFMHCFWSYWNPSNFASSACACVPVFLGLAWAFRHLCKSGRFCR